MAFSLVLGGCNNIAGTGGAAADDFPAASENTAKAELRGLPAVDALPPVVPEAQGRAQVADVTGPRKPHVAWSLALPFSQKGIVRVIGGDGTVYVSGYDGVGAVRDGKLIWAVHAPDPRLTMSDDGRIWFPVSGGGGYYCLNRAGQGGMFLGRVVLPPSAAEEPRAGCTEGRRTVVVDGPTGRRIEARLEYACTGPQAVVGPDGMVYVGTEAPDIRGFTPDGAAAWKIATSCAVQKLLAGPGGRVLFACQDLSLHYIENGTLRWNKPGDGEMQMGDLLRSSSSFVGLMDRNGTTYFVDSAADGSAHVHALSGTGDMKWTLKTPNFMASSIAFDGQGRIYLAGMRGMGSVLVCISD
jgi:outer membrane protein assembly factor BamB